MTYKEGWGISRSMKWGAWGTVSAAAEHSLVSEEEKNITEEMGWSHNFGRVHSGSEKEGGG